MPANPQQIVKRWERSMARDSTFRTSWQELKNYLSPNHAEITSTASLGSKMTQYLFDSTGAVKAKLLASTLTATIWPPSQATFRLTMRQAALNRFKDVRDWLDDVADITRLAMTQSNHLVELHRTFEEQVVFGTASLFIEPSDAGYAGAFGGLRYRALPIGSYTIGEDADQRVNELIRRFPMSLEALVAKWPDAAKLDAVKKMQDKDGDEPVYVLHSVYPRTDRKPSRKTAAHMPSGSCYVLLASSGEQAPILLDEGGFEEFPYAVSRWDKVLGEVWGRGPSWLALPDIKTLNRAVEVWLGTVGKNLDPPLLLDDDSIVGGGTLSLEPAAMNFRRPDSKIEPLESRHRLDIAVEAFNRLEAKISETLFADALRLRFKPEMTATEVVALQEEMLRLLGPSAASTLVDLTSPDIERTVAILERAGQLPPTPQELLDYEGDIDIEYEGPLARAQKSNDLIAMDRTVAFVGNLVATSQKPELWDNLNLDEQVQHYAQIAGSPGATIRGPEQREQIRTARQQAEQAAAKLNAMAQMAEAAGKAAPALKVMQQAQQPAEAAA